MSNDCKVKVLLRCPKSFQSRPTNTQQLMNLKEPTIEESTSKIIDKELLISLISASNAILSENKEKTHILDSSKQG